MKRECREDGGWFCRLKEHKRTCYIIAGFVFLSMILMIQARQQVDDGTLYVERSPAGTVAEQRIYSYQLEGMDPSEIQVEVAPVQLTEDQVLECLEQARLEWEELYLGNNKAPEMIRQDLVFPTQLCDGLVQVSYESSDYSLLQDDGRIHQQNLSEEGALVELTVIFQCQGVERRDSMFLQILDPEPESAAWYQWRLGNLIREQEALDGTAGGFEMPTSVEGKSISWQKERDHTWIFLLLLGGMAALCLELRDQEAQKQQEKKRREQLLYEYPQMVDQISMLICSGMTIRGAWERILFMNQEMNGDREEPEKAYVQEMWITYREIKSGSSERRSYEQFGQRIGLAPYKRFATVLSQNLMKGSRDLKQLLDQESLEALELRKNQAIRRGEEAGTKLLLPMLVMFVLILLILLVPAAKQFMMT